MNCPKCGGAMGAPRYKPAGHPGPSRGGYAVPNTEESLLRHCGTCGYISEEPTLDQQRAEAAASKALEQLGR